MTVCLSELTVTLWIMCWICQIEGFNNETDDEFIPYEQDLSSESDDDPTEEETVPNAGEVQKVCSSSFLEESDWGPKDDQPLSSRL